MLVSGKDIFNEHCPVKFQMLLIAFPPGDAG